MDQAQLGVERAVYLEGEDLMAVRVARAYLAGGKPADVQAAFGDILRSVALR